MSGFPAASLPGASPEPEYKRCAALECCPSHPALALLNLFAPALHPFVHGLRLGPVVGSARLPSLSAAAGLLLHSGGFI